MLSVDLDSVVCCSIHLRRLNHGEFKARGYGSDLTDAQWKALAPLLVSKRKDLRGPRVKGGFRKRINVILYLTKTGCRWR